MIPTSIELVFHPASPMPATKSGWALLFLRISEPARLGSARREAGSGASAAFQCMFAASTAAATEKEMLLLFPEQKETAATINQCVVCRINFGPHAREIVLLAIAKDPHGPRPVVQAVQPEKVSVLRITEQQG